MGRLAAAPADAWCGTRRTDTLHDHQRARQHLLRRRGARCPTAGCSSPGGYGGSSTGNIGIVDTNIFDPATEHLDPGREHAPAALVPDAHRAGRRPLRRHQRQRHRRARTGPTRPRSTTRRPTRGRCSPASPPRRSTRRSTRSPTCCPNGKVFTIGPSEDKSLHSSTSTRKTWTPVGGASGMTNGSSVMYRPGKILYTGGAADVESARAGAGRRRPSSTSTAADARVAARPRRWPTPASTTRSPCWPTARCSRSAAQRHERPAQTITTRRAARPRSGTRPPRPGRPARRWRPPATTTRPRVLMPDGRVLVAGGGHADSASATRASSRRRSTRRPTCPTGPADDHRRRPAPPPTARPITVTTPDAAVDHRGEPRLARRRHAPARHEPALRAAELHRRRRVADRAGARRRPRSPRPATTCCSSSTPRASRRWPRSCSSASAVRPRPAPRPGVSATAGERRGVASPGRRPTNGGSTDHAATPSPPTWAGVAQPPTTVTGNPPATVGDRHRPDQRHDLHVHGHRDQRGRDRAGVGAVERGHADGRHARRRSCSRSRPATRHCHAAVTPTNNDHRRQPPGRRGGRLELAHTTRDVGDRLGREHLHQAQAVPGVGGHRAERVVGADHRRRRHQARHHRPHRLVGRRRRRGGRVLGLVAGRWRGGRRRLEPGDGHDVGRSRGPVGARRRRRRRRTSSRSASTPTPVSTRR